MNPLIIVNGNSGTGKRTVSRFLEDRLDNYRRFSPDDTRRKLGRPDYDPRDTGEVLLHMYQEISETLQDEGGVIVHSHYKSSVGRQIVYDIAFCYNVPVLLIECICPEEVAKSRIRSRSKKDELHSPPTDPAVYDRLKAIWEDTEQDFARNRHVSWIRYDSHTSDVREILVRTGLIEFSSQIIELLQYVRS
ncbi:AAA family ATPase [Candidatus Woesearchaeota archaeon]|nr:AAA family ATPase [Candidatus Woesearchaeota archaeon]